MAAPSFKRELSLAGIGSSAFVFGPRMTGKTTLLESLACPHYFDLLNPEEELRFKGQPGLFWEALKACAPGSRIIVDEIQKVPALLDYVQLGIQKLKHKFILSGSSARKLKRGGANLLGGRALNLKLHPLTEREIGKSFLVANALQYGTLPFIYGLVADGKKDEARRFLKSYVTTYIKEEIQAEALTRNLAAFQRFFPVAAQSIAQRAQASGSTVRQVVFEMGLMTHEQFDAVLGDVRKLTGPQSR